MAPTVCLATLRKAVNVYNNLVIIISGLSRYVEGPVIMHWSSPKESSTMMGPSEDDVGFLFFLCDAL